MAYFRNNTVNLLNLHYGLHSLALSGSGAFFAVFLLKSGVPARPCSRPSPLFWSDAC
jgi:MFS transporter, DHA1 family, inner membrane transport protein